MDINTASDEATEESGEPDPLLQAIDLEYVRLESPSLVSSCSRPQPEQMIVPASRQVSSSSLASKARVAPSALNQLRLRGIERLRTQLSTTCSTSLVTMDQIANVLANYADDAPLTVCSYMLMTSAHRGIGCTDTTHSPDTGNTADVV